MHPAFLPLALATLGMPADDPAPVVPVPSSVQLVGPMEVRIRYFPGISKANEKPIIEDVLKKTIPYYEMGWAGNEAVPRGGEPLGRLRIAGARVVEEGSALVLATDPHPRRAVYVLDWIDGHQPSANRYAYSGVEESWFRGPEGEPSAASWVRDAFLERPGHGGPLMLRLGNPRRVELRASLLVPKGKETLVLKGNLPFEGTVGGKDFEAPPGEGKARRLEIPLESTGEPIDLLAILTTKEIGPAWDFSACWKRGEEDVAIPSSQLALPWLPILPVAAKVPEPPYRLDGGDAKRGAEVFASEAAKCATCHAIGGKGGAIGPSLDGLTKRDLTTIYRDIAEPSAVIVPEYLTYTVARKDGQIAVGVLRAEGLDAVRVADINGKTTTIPRGEIEEMRPSTTSTMPVGLAGAMGEEKMRDLLAFLKSGAK